MDILQILSNTASSILSPTTIGWALAALGLAVHFGFGGLLNFGIAGYMAIGAYGYAISVLTFGLPWWTGVLVGMAGSIVFSLVLGIPTLRLRGDYLAIVTIAAAEIVRLLFLTNTFSSVTGSANGLSGYNSDFQSINPIPRGSYGFGPWTYTNNQWWQIILGLALLTACVLVIFFLVRSPWGRVLKGIREDEDAVRALGKNVFQFKLQALIIGGIFASLGGIVVAVGSNINPNVYVTAQTFFIWTALLLGGAATVFGPVLGSVIFWALQTVLSNVLPALVSIGVLPFLSSSQAGTLRFILVGVGLMLIVIFVPQGIFGKKKELTFVK